MPHPVHDMLRVITSSDCDRGVGFHRVVHNIIVTHHRQLKASPNVCVLCQRNRPVTEVPEITDAPVVLRSHDPVRVAGNNAILRDTLDDEI